MNLNEETKRDEHIEKISARDGWLSLAFLIAVGFLIYFLGHK